jgi:cytochrome c1
MCEVAMRKHRQLALLLLSTVAGMPIAGCFGGQTLRPYAIAVDGNPQHGKALIEGYGCGGCHTIPGIHKANGLVGPPLMYFSRRTMIAGELPNTQANLVRWIQHPRSVEPGTAMPDLGLNQDQSYDISAYLYTLR